ncbi:TOPRIM nucleotidyl transferase/hydrolase domain-containing protein [Acetomicrobium sp. UBA5826]
MKFFARFDILVEGETEGLALPEYLAVVGLDCNQKRGVNNCSAGGN